MLKNVKKKIRKKHDLNCGACGGSGKFVMPIPVSSPMVFRCLEDQPISQEFDCGCSPGNPRKMPPPFKSKDCSRDNPGCKCRKSYYG